MGVITPIPIFKEIIMKTFLFENLMNKEKFYCNNIKDVKTIDGIEYLRVFKFGTQRDCLIRKDSLKKIKEDKVK